MLSYAKSSYANSAASWVFPDSAKFWDMMFYKGISFVFCIVKMTKIAKFGRVGERPSVVRI